MQIARGRKLLQLQSLVEIHRKTFLVVSFTLHLLLACVILGDFTFVIVGCRETAAMEEFEDQDNWTPIIGEQLVQVTKEFNIGE